jgi:hypothetical protein
MPDHHRWLPAENDPKNWGFRNALLEPHVDRRSASVEVKVADQIDIAPRDGRNAFENLDGV